jgi:hypothetical protein
MLKSDAVPDPWAVAAHTQLVLDGKVSPILLWEKHNVFVIAATVLSLVLLMTIKRMIFGRRPKIIVQHVQVSAGPKSSGAVGDGSAGPIQTAAKQKMREKS